MRGLAIVSNNIINVGGFGLTPFVGVAVLAYTTSWFGDKYYLRGPILVFNSRICFIELPIMVISHIIPF